MLPDDRRPDVRRPVAGVGAVVLKGRQVLLIRRGKPPREGQWSLPGGRLEWGETAAEAARREVAEETSVGCEVLGLLDVADGFVHDDAGALAAHYLLVDFAALWTAGEPRAGSDAADARWFSEAELADLAMWPETHRIVALALARFAGG